MTIFKIGQEHITDGKLTLPEIPEGTTELDFSECIDVTSIEGGAFPNRVDIPNGSFPRLKSITNVVFDTYTVDLTDHKNLTSVARTTFNHNVILTGCIKLTSVADIIFNGWAVLIGCTSLTSVAGARFMGPANIPLQTFLHILGNCGCHSPTNFSDTKLQSIYEFRRRYFCF